MNTENDGMENGKRTSFQICFLLDIVQFGLPKIPSIPVWLGVCKHPTGDPVRNKNNGFLSIGSCFSTRSKITWGLTWNWKKRHWKKDIFFVDTTIFRFHVKLQGGIQKVHDRKFGQKSY